MRAWAVTVALCCAVVVVSGHDVEPLDQAPALGDAKGAGAAHLGGLSRSEKKVALAADAKAFAKLHKMPGTFACYNAQTKEAAKLAGAVDVAKMKAVAADKEFKALNDVYKKTKADVAGGKSRKAKLHQKIAKEKALYKATHKVAMNLYEVAKKDLNGYQLERKKVSLDAKQSKDTLETYLRYKKKYIAVSADAQDPKQSKTVARYLKLSQQYLKNYHKVQLAVKTSYGRAQTHQSSYFKISRQYQAKAAEAKGVSREVTQTSANLAATHKALVGAQKKAAAQKAALPPLKKKKAAADAARAKAEAKHKAAADKAKATKNKYFELSSKAAAVKSMHSNAKQAWERNKLRHAEFMATFKDKNTSAKGVQDSMKLLTAKIKAAKHTASLYDKSFQVNNCKTKEEAEEELGEDAKATQTAEEAASVAQCKEDAKVAASNKEAAKTAASQHKAEGSRLAVLRKEASEAKSGATLAAKVRDAKKAQMDRLGAAHKALEAAAKKPC